MCLSKAYRIAKNGSETLISEYVSQVRCKDGHVLLRDLMGAHYDVEGKLESIDLEGNVLRIAVP